MEYMEEGTLYEKMQNQKKCFNEYEVAQTTLEISRAVQALDDKYVAHRDIKPENILMSHVINETNRRVYRNCRTSDGRLYAMIGEQHIALPLPTYHHK
jgi:serine/threonine protein kinase